MTNQTVTVTVPFAIRKRGGRTLVITPDGVTSAPAPRTRVDSALLKALARGFRWRKLLETGHFATIEEIADAENINSSYISRLLRMTLLAPEIVEAILAGSHPAGLTRAKVMKPFPVEWIFQIERINLSEMVQAEDSNLQKRFWNRASRNETSP
jgi:hypothetical protein